MIKRTTLFLSILLCFPMLVSAQGYLVEYRVNTYEPLIDANLLDESDPGIDGSGSELYQSIPIGFDFTYHDMTFNSLEVGENGYVIFSQAGAFKSFINIFECRQMNFQDDPLLSPIYYEVSGDVGDRIFKLEFVKSGFVNDDEQDDYVNYQLWIYEKCNVFEIHIGEVSIDPSELDLFYNSTPAPFMGYGNNDPYFFYILDGSLTAPDLVFYALSSLDSIPNPNSVYRFNNCVVSIDEEEESSFSIYPNPVTDVVTFKFNETIEESELRILNLNGQTVYTEILAAGNSYSLNTDFLTQGIYVVNIRSASTFYSTKLVKK